MRNTEQLTFWEFTMESTKEAVRLYFEPLRKTAAWFSEDEQADGAARRDDIEARLQNLKRRVGPSFDSLEDLELRFKRVELESLSRSEPESLGRLNDIEDLLESAQFAKRNGSASLPEILHEVRIKIRAMEIHLGFEKSLQPSEGKRTRGASGD